MSDEDGAKITLASSSSDRSELLTVHLDSTTVEELMEWSNVLFNATMATHSITKNGRPLSLSKTLGEEGVRDGDLLVVEGAAAPAAGGGLDFSSLLNVNAAAPPAAQGAPAANPLAPPPVPVYYPGMSLDDATMHNPHPEAFVSILQKHDHLFKEFNYHMPLLAQRMKDKPLAQAVSIWREHLVRGGIQHAMKQSERFHKERDMQRRLAQNPNDEAALDYYAERKRLEMVDSQYRQTMQEYPETLTRVLMLYVQVKINGHELQAFVDSGAQFSIMSKKLAVKCGLWDMVDTRFQGVAVGVGTNKILGRIHMLQLQVGNIFLPCSVQVLDDAAPLQEGAGAKRAEMEFLLGLDMLKRHTCHIDLEHGVLKFRTAPGQYMDTPFLHEKDLDESKGGTKGFDAEKANQELTELQKKHEKDNGMDAD